MGFTQNSMTTTKKPLPGYKTFLVDLVGGGEFHVMYRLESVADVMEKARQYKFLANDDQAAPFHAIAKITAQ